METGSSAEHHQLRVRNAQLEEELELLRGVLALVKEDLHVKDHQIDHLYSTCVRSIVALLLRPACLRKSHCGAYCMLQSDFLLRRSTSARSRSSARTP